MWIKSFSSYSQFIAKSVHCVLFHSIQCPFGLRFPHFSAIVQKMLEIWWHLSGTDPFKHSLTICYFPTFWRKCKQMSACSNTSHQMGKGVFPDGAVWVMVWYGTYTVDKPSMRIYWSLTTPSLIFSSDFHKLWTDDLAFNIGLELHCEGIPSCFAFSVDSLRRC